MDNGKLEYSIPKWLRRLQENSREMAFGKDRHRFHNITFWKDNN